MSKDSSATYIHMHSPRLADLFEEFCRPPSSISFASTQSNNSNNPAFSFSSHAPAHPPAPGTTNNTNGGNHANSNNSAAVVDNMAQLPGHFLPFEEIFLPAHLMPVNPEDEDDVVPDMHAAYGINRALGQGQEGAAVAAAGSGGGGGGGNVGGVGAGLVSEPAWRDFGLEELMGEGSGTWPCASCGRCGWWSGYVGDEQEGREAGRVEDDEVM